MIDILDRCLCYYPSITRTFQNNGMPSSHSSRTIWEGRIRFTMRENHEKGRKDQINVTGASAQVLAQIKNLEDQFVELAAIVTKHTILLTQIQAAVETYMVHQAAGQARILADSQVRADQIEALIRAQSAQITTLTHQIAEWRNRPDVSDN